MLPISTYYSDPKVSYAQREEQEADLRDQIEKIRFEFPKTGYRRILEYLNRNNIKIGERKLRRIMCKFNLQLKPKKRFVHTTDSNHDYLVYPNLLPNMAVSGPNQVWTADITYIRIENGFVYLAVVMDLYSRKIIGWQISKRIDAQLAMDALRMAVSRRNPPRGVIHHSDRGVQYLSDGYVENLMAHGFHISCSAKGNPYDNAWTESLMKTIKSEEVYLYDYQTYLDVIDRLPKFIEEVYNKKRLHSSLKYLTPEEFEEKFELEYKNKPDRPEFNL